MSKIIIQTKDEYNKWKDDMVTPSACDLILFTTRLDKAIKAGRTRVVHVIAEFPLGA